MLLNKPAILITGEIDKLLLQQIVTAGFSVDVIPFIETKSIQTKAIEQTICGISTLNATVVFTSSNAVKAVQYYTPNKEANWKIYCVGDSTKSLVKKTFVLSSVCGVADNAQQLSELIIADKHKKIYFFSGNKRRDELPDLLKKNNIVVNELEVYETIVLHHTVDKKYDGILFFSPSAAEGFFSNNSADDSTVLFAIGSTTADELKKFSASKIVVSDKPGKEALVNKLIEFFK